MQKIAHSTVTPNATYSPWINNEKFKEIFRIAKNYTLVDEFRMYELHNLALQAAKLGGDFLEVGVWKGGTSAIITAALNESNFNGNFYIADTFQGVVKAGSVKDNIYRGGEHADADVSDVEELYNHLELMKPKVLVGIFPDDHPTLEIDKLAFVHSDVDAYESTKGVVEWCLPRLMSGGVIVFDDYGFSTCEGVTHYVNELMCIDDISLGFTFIHNLNGHAILIKK